MKVHDQYNITNVIHAIPYFKELRYWKQQFSGVPMNSMANVPGGWTLFVLVRRLIFSDGDRRERSKRKNIVD